MNNILELHHAYIIESDKHTTKEYAQQICQKIFCKDNACNYCAICNMIKNNQFYSIKWLSKNSYNLEDIDEIIDITRLSLQEDEIFLFVIENSDKINDSAANRLLKLVEEPPIGYKFLFLTQNANTIISTIRSRCILHSIKSQNCVNFTDPIIKCFTCEQREMMNAADFMNLISKSELSESDTKDYLTQILQFWITRLKNENSDRSINILNLIEEQFHQMPMPGGSKIFWKNFYLKFSML